MPKRADEYMAVQREHIAATVFHLIRDEGLHDTTLRRICERAKVSMGAFYVHFRSKWEAIDAALSWNSENIDTPPLPANWEGFEQLLLPSSDPWNDNEQRKLLRLSFELAAAAAVSDEKWHAPALALEVTLNYIEQALRHLSSTGEIRIKSDPRTLAKQVIAAVSGANFIAALVPESRTAPDGEDIRAFVRQIAGRLPETAKCP